MNKPFRILALLLLVSILISQTGIVQTLLRPSHVYAVGDLTVDWGIGIGDVGPIFDITDMAPGDSETREVEITNGSGTGRPLGIRGVRTDDGTSILPEELFITISEGGSDVYGGTTGEKSLIDFFNDSVDPTFIKLVTINGGTTKTLHIKVEFDEDAGNEYQNLTVVFDIRIGIAFDMPEACEAITFKGNPIFGTAGNDRLNGTRHNDLIVALEGNDRIDGGLGDDCIVGDAGDDRLEGGNGQDVITGGPGNDRLDGGNGNDTMLGNEGEDVLDGGNGRDEMDGGTGNDKMDGGNGNDDLFGEEGNDEMKGGNGNDLLDGGEDIDTADGQNGRDTCIAESQKRCEL